VHGTINQVHSDLSRSGLIYQRIEATSIRDLTIDTGADRYPGGFLLVGCDMVLVNQLGNAKAIRGDHSFESPFGAEGWPCGRVDPPR
jgi:hypothetical protein